MRRQRAAVCRGHGRQRLGGYEPVGAGGRYGQQRRFQPCRHFQLFHRQPAGLPARGGRQHRPGRWLHKQCVAGIDERRGQLRRSAWRHPDPHGQRGHDGSRGLCAGSVPEGFGPHGRQLNQCPGPCQCVLERPPADRRAYRPRRQPRRQSQRGTGQALRSGERPDAVCRRERRFRLCSALRGRHSGQRSPICAYCRRPCPRRHAFRCAKHRHGPRQQRRRSIQRRGQLAGLYPRAAGRAQ